MHSYPYIYITIAFVPYLERIFVPVTSFYTLILYHINIIHNNLISVIFNNILGMLADLLFNTYLMYIPQSSHYTEARFIATQR